jgi:hypothetical protein
MNLNHTSSGKYCLFLNRKAVIRNFLRQLLIFFKSHRAPCCEEQYKYNLFHTCLENFMSVSRT